MRSKASARSTQERQGSEIWLTAAPDGQRFLHTVPAEDAEPVSIAIEANWLAQMQR